ncbi:MAG: pyrroloquinoline quinone-dependent dehydrogenase [Methyloceanibacter sp.]
MKVSSFRHSVAAVLVAVSSASAGAEEQPPLQPYRAVTGEVLLNPSPADWLMWRRTYDSWGHSPLDQIDAKNVSRLQLAWAYTQEPGNQEASPLVNNGIMYLAQSQNVVHALDATNGNLIWEYRHPLPAFKGKYVKRQLLRSRNAIALYGDNVYLATGDARLVALDARTGKVVWNVEVADYNPGFNYTAGPLIVKDMVVVGISGCTTPDTGGGCFLTAHDVETGKEHWRLHTIARPDDPNDATWAGIPLKERNGGSMWGTGAYDHELNLIYWGVAPPIPHSDLARGTKEAAHLYTNSTLAIDPDTGKIVWYFQHLPSDNWNLDHASERVLVDVKDGEEVKKILLTVGKTGIVWALDRKTGKYLWSTETVHQNVISNIDESGRITLNDAVKPKELDVDYFACPSLYGGKIWQATAYNPNTKALYVPLANMCNDYKVVEQAPDPGEDFGRGRFTARQAPDNNGLVGRIEAVDVTTGKSVWNHERRAIISGGLLTTGGDLVIGGDGGRRALALDARTGTVLWELPVASSVGGFPMTYMVNGRQYLAIPVGSNKLTQFSAPLTPEAINPADLDEGKGSALMVFALPQGAGPPAVAEADK